MSGTDSDSSKETVILFGEKQGKSKIKKKYKMSAANFIGNIEHFTPGDDFSNYIERVDELLKLNNVKEENKVSLLVGICGADLYKIMKSVVAPKSTAEINYDELKKLLKAYFDPKRNTIGERFAFHRRQQKPDESIGDYIIEIKSLSQTCEFGEFLDEALRDKLIFGVHDTAIQRKLANAKDLTFDLACTTAKLMEMTEQNLSDMKNSDSAVAAIRGRKSQYGSKSNKNGASVFSRLSNKDKEDNKNKKSRSMKCFLCNKMGHMVRNCFKNPNRVQNSRRGEEAKIQSNTEEDNGDISYINKVLASGPVFMEVSVNHKVIKMELDTGACRSVMHRAHKEKYFPNVELRKCERNLFSVSGQKLNISGVCLVTVENVSKTRTHECELTIVESAREFMPLLGRDWLDIVSPTWRTKFSVNSLRLDSNQINTKEIINTLRAKYPIVFSSISAGTIKDFKVDLTLEENAKPIFFKPYQVPYGLRDAVEAEIDRLRNLGIIYPVRNSAWASPVVIVNKPDGSIRMCVDCKVTINKYLKVDHYPLPRIDDLLASLANAKYFCVLDLREAYAQMAVADESQEYLTINTHIGLFRYRRLIFGVSCAPTLFQSMMDQIIQGLKRIACFIDDLLIGGETLAECYENLLKVLDRLSEYNVKIKFEKCKFFQTSVKYLGHEISEEGVRPNAEKVKAIVDAPPPTNLTQVKSYLGLINYYGRFIPNLSSELLELYKLTKKGVPFQWSKECQIAFERSKKLLMTNNLLVHYDPNKEIVIHCDASPYGLGAILSHVIEGKDRPVLFTSCTLTSAQKNYAQLHREALAIVFAVKKFHKYIFGKKFVIYSDHQPLREIFNEKKSVPVASGRLQRWAIFLAMYDYHIEYRKGTKMGNADALSRLPVAIENDIETQNIHAFGEAIPVDRRIVGEETKSDSILTKVKMAMESSWKSNFDEKLRKFYNKRLMISLENGILYYGNRMIIPEKLQIKILNLLHDTHVGVCRMKAAARRYVWWPNIDKDIEEYARVCEPCQLMQNTPSATSLTKWKETTVFFERIHLDFFFWNKQTFFLVVDTFSRWFDVKIMTSTTSSKVIGELRIIFGYFGLPTMIVSDNGPPFNSHEFIRFCQNNDIKCMKSPPYHPQSNGWAECGVRTVKQSLKKMLIESGNCVANSALLLARFLIKYRNTPVTTTGQTPSDRIFNYRPRTLMDVLNAESKTYEIRKAVMNEKTSEHTANIIAHTTYKVNELVVYRNENHNEVKWLKAKIIKILSKCRYTIQLLTRGSIRDCHGEQLRPFNQKNFFSQLPTSRCRTSKQINEENRAQNAPTQEEIEDENITTEASIGQPSTSTPKRSERLKDKPAVSYKETRVRPLKRKREIN